MLTAQVRTPCREVNFNIISCTCRTATEEIQQSQAELRQKLVRSKTEGAQFRSLREETRSANAGVASEVSRLRAREEQLVTDVSTLQNRDTDLQRHLQNHRQENARINACMNQIQITTIQ